MLIFNEVTLKKDKVYHLSDNKNGSVSNDRYALICAKSGYLAINCNTLSLLLPNQCALIDKDAIFTIKNVSGFDASFITVSIKSDILDGFIKNYPEFAKYFSKNLSLIFSPNATLIDLFLTQLNNNGATLISLAFTLISNAIDELYGFKNLNKTECATLLKSRIDSHTFLTDKIYDEYKKYPISHTLLINEFKALTGFTPIDYALNKKVELSKVLLTKTSLLVNEISEVAGYKSISHFIKKFKEKTGVTPLLYKNSN